MSPAIVRALRVVAAGPRTTVQDRGRAGLAHLGVTASGALDQPALALANRLVGNPADAAGLETTLGGCAVRSTGATVTVAVTGALCQLRIGGRSADQRAPLILTAGSVLTVGPAIQGVRSYLAAAGGISVQPVLGSRSTDTLSGLGPPVLSVGDVLPVGPRPGPPAPIDAVPYDPVADPVVLDIGPGPRADWLTPAGMAALTATTWLVSADSDRIGARLSGPPLDREQRGDLLSEGVVLGSVQVPPDGVPLVFLADHPTTGGYPVVAVVDRRDLPALAQARPGTGLRFRLATRRHRSGPEPRTLWR